MEDDIFFYKIVVYKEHEQGGNAQQIHHCLIVSSNLFSSPCPLIHVKADRPPPKKEQTYSRGGHPKIMNL